MLTTLKNVVDTGSKVGLLRDTAAIKAQSDGDAIHWDKWVRNQPDLYYVVWEGTPAWVHIAGLPGSAPTLGSMPTATTTTTTANNNTTTTTTTSTTTSTTTANNNANTAITADNKPPNHAPSHSHHQNLNTT